MFGWLLVGYQMSSGIPEMILAGIPSLMEAGCQQKAERCTEACRYQNAHDPNAQRDGHRRHLPKKSCCMAFIIKAAAEQKKTMPNTNTLRINKAIVYIMHPSFPVFFSVLSVYGSETKVCI